MPGPAPSAVDAPPENTIETLVDRVALLEALLTERNQESQPAKKSDESNEMTRKPKGGPIDEETLKNLVARRERLELARMAEQTAWEEMKEAVCLAAERGVSYREIGNAVGVTRARIYQIVSGKR